MIVRIKSRILKLFLRILGLTGILFVMESCYGAPSAYLIKTPVQDDLNKPVMVAFADSNSVEIK